jgi:hypothetical protein
MTLPEQTGYAQHLTMATIAQVDALVSWKFRRKFRHVVIPRIHRYHAANAKLGHPTIEIPRGASQ